MAKPVAIITGAGRGIGRATASELAGRGFDLVLTSRTRDDLETTAANLSGAMLVPGDVTDPTHANVLVAAALKTFNRVDVIVNNAGFAPLLSMEQATADDWRKIIDTNLSAAFYLMKAAWPVFKGQGSGTIINISSEAARDPFPGLGLYGAAKVGLHLLGLSIAREGDPLGIRVHTIAPSATETGMFRSLMTPEQMPTEKVLDPKDIAKVIAACATGDLRYSSGEVIYLHKTL